MGNEDIRIKNLLSDVHRFADLYNGGLFNGQQILRPEDLTILNNESGLVLKDKDGGENSINRYRDIVMKSEGALLMVRLASENQSKIHYAMAVRGMLYDALDYTEQVQNIKKRHRKDKDLKGSAEFLSGFTKEDRLLPVISLVFYYGDDPWDASLDIHDMLNLDQNSEAYRKVKGFIPNYKINLIDIKRFKDTDNFKTDLHELFTMVKYRQNQQAFKEYIMEHQSYFKQIDTDTYEAARVLLGSGRELITTEVGKETVNMCEALEGIFRDGVQQGIETTRIENVKGMRKEGIPEDVIMRITKLTKEELEKIE